MDDQTKKQTIRRTPAEYVKLFLGGFIMGGADVVPGVSGGTMAFILGIYNELLNAIRTILSPDTVKMAAGFQIKKMFQTLPWPFLMTLGFGILSAILLLSSPIKWMLENRLSLILAFFFGLVLGSVATVLRQVEKWDWSRFTALIAGAAGGFLLVGLPMLASPPDSKLYLMLCGAIAICAMILPGISGSFMLLLLGKYDYILNAVHELKKRINIEENLLTLAIFCIGLVIGISFFVRILGWLLKKYHDLTVAVLIGFMIGSLRKVWPWKTAGKIEGSNIIPECNMEFFWALGLAAAGLVIVLLIEYIARKLQYKENK